MNYACTLRAALVLGVAMLVFLAGIVPGESTSSLNVTTVRECEDLPGDGEDLVSGTTYAIMNAVNCTTAKTIHCREGRVIVANTQGDMNTWNVHFHVHEGGSLEMMSNKAVIIQREEGKEHETQRPLFLISGKVDIAVRGWTPSHIDGAIDDKAGVIQTTSTGSLITSSHGHILYTPDSVIVATLLGARDEKIKTKAARKAAAIDIPWIPPPTDILLDVGVAMARKITSRSVSLRDGVLQPRRTLRCGEVLQGKMLCDGDATAALWQGVEGSVLHGTDSSTSAKKQRLGQADLVLHPVTLIGSNEAKVTKVWMARQASEEALAKLEGDEYRWSPWAIKRTVANTNTGVTGITIDERGCIHSIMDGKVVLSKCGKRRYNWMNKVPWQRSRSDEYELRVNPEGIEVCRGRKTVWGIPVDKAK